MTKFQRALLTLVRGGLHRPEHLWPRLKTQGFYWAHFRLYLNLGELEALGYVQRQGVDYYVLTGRGCIVLADLYET